MRWAIAAMCFFVLRDLRNRACVGGISASIHGVKRNPTKRSATRFTMDESDIGRREAVLFDLGAPIKRTSR